MAGSSGGGGGRCQVCFKFIFTSGITALVLWLSLRTSNPRCSIQYFYVPAINKTANSASNTTIYFDLKLDNENKMKGIYYDVLNLTFYYGPNRSLPVANTTFPAFYQGHKKNTHRKELLNTYGVPWETVFRDVSNGKAVFRVDLATAVRFKVMAWKIKRHTLVEGTKVDVNDTGGKVEKKGIKLIESTAPEFDSYRTRRGIWLVSSILFFVFI